MTSIGARIGTLAIQAYWELERYAYYVPRGEISKSEAFGLADNLEQLAKVIRVHHTEPVRTDGEG